MQRLQEVKRALAAIFVFGSFVYIVALGLIHPSWARSGIAFFDAWYEWYPALVVMFIGLHLDGAFDPKK